MQGGDEAEGKISKAGRSCPRGARGRARRARGVYCLKTALEDGRPKGSEVRGGDQPRGRPQVLVGGDRGLDLVAYVRRSARACHKVTPQVFVPLVPGLVTINTLVTPHTGQGSAGPKAEGLSGRPRQSPVGRAGLLTPFYG